MNKRRWRNRKDAAAARSRSTRIYGQEFDYYKCPFCSSWHVGHKIQVAQVAFVSWLPYEKNFLRVKR